MNNREAIQVLNEVAYECGSFRRVEAVNMGQEALRYRESKAVEVTADRNYTCFICPKCGKEVMSVHRQLAVSALKDRSVEKPRYCRNCGQKLGWKTATEKARGVIIGKMA